MGLFKDVLGNQESVFRDHIPLDYDYIPKLVPYREQQQRQIAACIKPLLTKRNGRNVFVHGPPGVGKTVAVKHLLKELEEETEEIVPLYINCWQKNSMYKIVLEICDLLDYRFTHNKKTDELFKIIKDILNKKAVVIVLDEADKLEDEDLIYNVLEEIYRRTVILITNYKDWMANLDNRIKSRLTAEVVEFSHYTKEETHGVLSERMKYAFYPDAWDEDAFALAADKAHELKDIRLGLYLLREAGNAAEDKASKRITKDHVNVGISKLEEFSIKEKEALEDETKFILTVVKNNTGKKIGDIFKAYQTEGGNSGYKTFQRKIAKLSDNKFVSVKKISGGADGNTTLITYNGSVTQLSDF
ncbi:AAA family ATPase [Candidatus Woesearchaeota archaeon]|nr:AAA family ATPase [Candidatus Woesearchaeota archaeon]